MPYLKKYYKSKRGRPRGKKGTHYSSFNPKTYYKNKAKNKKLTKKIKKVAEKVISKKFEMNYIANDTELLLKLGTPGMQSNGNVNDPRSRCILLTNYIDTYHLDKNEAPPVPTTTNGDGCYQTKQKLYLQNLQCKMEIISPYGQNGVSTRMSSNWCTVHWALIKTANNVYNQPPVLEDLFKENWAEQTAFHRREKKTTGYTIVKRGQINCNPSRETAAALSREPRTIRKTLNLPIKKTISLQRAIAGTHTNATITGNLNSTNYFLAIWCQQQFQKLGANYMFNNYKHRDNSADANTTDGSINCGPTLTMTYTLSGYGLGQSS